MLGVLMEDGRDPEDPDSLPEHLGRFFTSDGVALYGDFRVCPLTLEKAGWMQMVCIAHAEHLVAGKR